VERRLEDHIRLLCERLITVPADAEEFHMIAEELQAALKEHTQRLRGNLRVYPLLKERRSDESTPQASKKKRYDPPALKLQIESE
jgi:hypothetical protein